MPSLKNKDSYFLTLAATIEALLTQLVHGRDQISKAASQLFSGRRKRKKSA
jgi:hypothetical protein